MIRPGLLAVTAVSMTVWLLAGAPALAHGMSLQLRSEAGFVVGQAQYSQTAPAYRETVQVTDLTDAAAPPVTLLTDADGKFRFEGVTGHRYRVTVQGAHDHSATMEVTLEAAAAADAAVDAEAGVDLSALAPAWIAAGVLLAVSSLALSGASRTDGAPMPIPA